MALTRWDPFTALARFDREFDDLIRRGWGNASRSGFVPPVEMLTRHQDVVIRLELPGVDIDRDVDIEVEEGRLVVRGERRDAWSGSDDSGVLVRELRYGSFRREFVLPDGVDAESIEATYDQGMLEVVVRNAVKQPPQPRQVKIRRGDESRQVEATPADPTTTTS